MTANRQKVPRFRRNRELRLRSKRNPTRNSVIVFPQRSNRLRRRRCSTRSGRSSSVVLPSPQRRSGPFLGSRDLNCRTLWERPEEEAVPSSLEAPQRNPVDPFRRRWFGSRRLPRCSFPIRREQEAVPASSVEQAPPRNSVEKRTSRPEMSPSFSARRY